MTGSHTILIVDDEPNLRTTLSLILQHNGYSVTMAGSGEEALKTLCIGTFDLAFLDLKMPGMDGLTLLKKIRQLYPEMPILLLTAHASLESAINAVRHDANDYLLKPLNPNEILTRVKATLEKRTFVRRRQEIYYEMQSLITELNTIHHQDPPTNSISQQTAVSNDPARILQKGILTLDLYTHQVTLNGNNITLTPTTFDFLVTLMRHSPITVTYETLVMESQHYQPTPVEAREIAQWRIHELRKAIEPDSHKPRHIITERSVGYRLITE